MSRETIVPDGSRMVLVRMKDGKLVRMMVSTQAPVSTANPNAPTTGGICIVQQNGPGAAASRSRTAGHLAATVKRNAKSTNQKPAALIPTGKTYLKVVWEAPL